MLRPTLPALLLVSVATTGCFFQSSHYQPRQRGRQVALVLDDNRPALQGEGRTTSVGWFGGGLVERVEAVSEAASAARSYRKRVIWSAVTGIPSGACLIGGVLYYVDEVAQHGENYDPPLGFDFLMVGCAAGLLASQLLLVSANTYLYDAVNLYNDGVEAVDASAPQASVPFVNSKVLRAARAPQGIERAR